MKPRVLLTGGTGFLGQHLLPLLREWADVTTVSRSHPEGIRADLSQWDGGIMDASKYKGQFDILVHLAGLYNLRSQQLEAFKNNTAATHGALTMAQKMEIPFFVYASTVAVTCSLRQLSVNPEQIDTSGDFPDWYAQSKASAESMVRYWPVQIPMRLNLRLGILVGDSVNGKIERIDGPYHAGLFLKRLKPWLKYLPSRLPLPGNPRVRLPLVPVDIAASAINTLVKRDFTHGEYSYRSLYITPNEGISSDSFYRSAFRYLGIDKDFFLIKKVPNELLKALSQWTLNIPREELQYLLQLPRFENEETQKYLGMQWCPEFSVYEKSFWKGFEQHVQNT